MAKSVFIACPAGDGKFFHTTTRALVDLAAELTGQGWEFSLGVLPGSSLIDQARNILLQSFLESTHENLLWIDTDVGFKAADAMKLLECPEKIVGGVYPMKREDPAFPVRLIEPVNRKGDLVECYYLPGGFTRFKRSVIQDVIERYGEELRCEYDFGDKTMTVPHIYACGIGTSGRYCGEDVAVMNACRTAGYSVWADTTIQLNHTGIKTYEGDFGKWVEENHV